MPLTTPGLPRLPAACRTMWGRISRPAPGLHVTPEEWQGSNLLTLEAPISGMVAALTSSLLALFAIQLGGSNSLVGWITSGPALISLLWLIPAGRLIQHWGDYTRSFTLAILGNRLSLLALAAVPFLPETWRAWAVVAVVTLAAFPNGMWGTSMMSMAGEIFAPANLPKLLARRWATFYISSVAFTPLGGVFVDLVRFPLNFQLVFALAGLVGLTSIGFIRRIQLPERTPEDAPAESGAAPGALRLKTLVRYRSVLLFEIGIFVTYLAWFAAVPVYPIYWVRDLGATGVWIGVLAAVQWLGAAVGSTLWGRWSRPHRDRRNAMLIIWVGMAVYPALVSLFPYLGVQIAFVLLAGVGVAGSDMLLFNRMYHIFPRGERPTLFAFHQVVVNTAAFSAPLGSTVLIDLIGPRSVLLLIALLGLAGGGLVYWLGWAGQTALPPAGPDPALTP